MATISTQKVTSGSDPANRHPSFSETVADWERIRDCIKGESRIKQKKEDYLPRPAGMSGEYADAYDQYLERAHFPLVCGYALSGALGIIITKMPEFNVPKKLEYIIENATKDGQSIQSLFMNIVIEILQTGRCPLMVDIVADKNEFRFVQYSAENLINWKTEVINEEKNLILAVLEENIPAEEDIFSHEMIQIQRVLMIDENGKYVTKVFGPEGEYEELGKTPSYMGKRVSEIPLFIAGSINNSYEPQPIPLLAVANCSVQIYRKEADLANSEFLSCNPTLVFSGVSNEDDLPNVVGSSVLITLPDAQARAYYTETDTDALTHVKNHITDLYDEAIRHGVAILDTRKGVESAEALRIRQATQSASIYSVYLSAVTAVISGLKLMCQWQGLNEEEVVADSPGQLTYGIAESNVIREVNAGFTQGTVPLEVIHRYLVSTGLLEQTVGFEDYKVMLQDSAELRLAALEASLRIQTLGLNKNGDNKDTDGKDNKNNWGNNDKSSSGNSDDSGGDK